MTYILDQVGFKVRIGQGTTNIFDENKQLLHQSENNVAGIHLMKLKEACFLMSQKKS